MAPLEWSSLYPAGSEDWFLRELTGGMAAIFEAWWGMKRERLRTEAGARVLMIALNIACGVWGSGERAEEEEEEEEGERERQQ
jgi:hypothetical protein